MRLTPSSRTEADSTMRLERTLVSVRRLVCVVVFLDTGSQSVPRSSTAPLDVCTGGASIRGGSAPVRVVVRVVVTTIGAWRRRDGS